MAPIRTTHDYYAILEVSNTEVFDIIKKSYYRLSRELHPDKCPTENATANFQLLQEAWNTIKDSSRRRDYDLLWLNIRNKPQSEGDTTQKMWEEQRRSAAAAAAERQRKQDEDAKWAEEQRQKAAAAAERQRKKQEDAKWAEEKRQKTAATERQRKKDEDERRRQYDSGAAETARNEQDKARLKEYIRRAKENERRQADSTNNTRQDDAEAGRRRAAKEQEDLRRQKADAAEVERMRAAREKHYKAEQEREQRAKEHMRRERADAAEVERMRAAREKQERMEREWQQREPERTRKEQADAAEVERMRAAREKQQKAEQEWKQNAQEHFRKQRADAAEVERMRAARGKQHKVEQEWKRSAQEAFLKQRADAAEAERVRAARERENKLKMEQEKQQREQERLRKQRADAAEVERARAAKDKQEKLEREWQQKQAEHLRKQNAAAEAKRKAAAELEANAKKEQERKGTIRRLESQITAGNKILLDMEGQVQELESDLALLQNLDNEDEEWREKRNKSTWKSVSTQLFRTGREREELEIRQREANRIQREESRRVKNQRLESLEVQIEKARTRIDDLEKKLASKTGKIYIKKERPARESFNKVPIIEEEDEDGDKFAENPYERGPRKTYAQGDSSQPVPPAASHPNYGSDRRWSAPLGGNSTYETPPNQRSTSDPFTSQIPKTTDMPFRRASVNSTPKKSTSQYFQSGFTAEVPTPSPKRSSSQYFTRSSNPAMPTPPTENWNTSQMPPQPPPYTPASFSTGPSFARRTASQQFDSGSPTTPMQKNPEVRNFSAPSAFPPTENRNLKCKPSFFGSLKQKSRERSARRASMRMEEDGGYDSSNSFDSNKAQRGYAI